MTNRFVVFLAYVLAFSLALLAGAFIHPFAGILSTIVLAALVERGVWQVRHRWA